MIIVRRVKHRNQLASFNALLYGTAAIGGVLYMVVVNSGKTIENTLKNAQKLSKDFSS
jgi:hypothetical protein